jgi:hypothetical protein
MIAKVVMPHISHRHALAVKPSLAEGVVGQLGRAGRSKA